MHEMKPEYMGEITWRAARLVTAGDEFRFIYRRPALVNGDRRLTACTESWNDIAVVYWQVCPACRVGRLNKIGIAPHVQRRGLGRRMVRRLLRDGPTFAWTTTGQSNMARAFFPAMAQETGVAFPAHGGGEHVDAEVGRLSAPAAADRVP